MRVLSIAELNHTIKAVLESELDSEICVRGEISNLKMHSNGHIYFALKDNESSIRAVMWRSDATRLNVKLADGAKIIATGKINVYAAGGYYQFCAKSVALDGVGDLNEKLQNLKQKLQNLGYFDESLKKKLPRFPCRVALITSSTGAALQDMLRIASTRWGLTKFSVIDTLVQGENAKFDIAKNIKFADSFADSQNKFDVIVLARGGGSLEDLWAFNKEVVADAIFHARTPIISAIGHESDTLLSDYVADCRASTPSNAMQILLPDKFELLSRIDEMSENLNALFGRILREKFNALLAHKKLLSAHNFGVKLSVNFKDLQMAKTALNSVILEILKRKQNEILSAKLALDSEMQNFLKNAEFKLNESKLKLQATNPKNFHKNGYAQVSLAGKIVNLSELKKGDEIVLQDCERSVSAAVK